MNNTCKLLTISLSAFLVVGCANKTGKNQDPYEGYNRAMTKFNLGVDKVLYRPAAQVYKAVLPSPVRKGVTNFFNNVFEATTLTNDVLQGRFRWALVDIARLVVNTTIGIGGLFDVATHLDLPKHENGFGKTLAFYSDTNKSPYFVIPFLGPSTFRDALGLAGDVATNPIAYICSSATTYSLAAAFYIDKRSRYLDVDGLMYDAFDPYSALKNAYMQSRAESIEKNQHLGTPREVLREQKLLAAAENSGGDENGHGSRKRSSLEEEAASFDDFDDNSSHSSHKNVSQKSAKKSTANVAAHAHTSVKKKVSTLAKAPSFFDHAAAKPHHVVSFFDKGSV